jgi:serine O-acetyltransferase
MRAIVAAAAACATRLSDQGPVIAADVRRWQFHQHTAAPPRRALRNLVAGSRDFRTVLYRRLWDGNRAGSLLASLLSRILRPRESCYVGGGPVGPGLYLLHAFSTIVNAETMGSDCFIANGVTVGADVAGNRPRVGNQVAVYANATILGGVTIGDYALVGANALVIDDVPAGATVGGVPARVVSRREYPPYGSDPLQSGPAC